MTDKGNELLKGIIDIQFEHPFPSELRFTRQGLQIIIDSDIRDSIDWRGITEDVGKIIYWNYTEDKKLNINDLIPNQINNHDKVLKKLAEIICQAYHVSYDGTFFTIPKKVDLDIYGNEVKSLQLPFEECLAQLKAFIVKNNRYPKMNSQAEETALRKWFREVGHGVLYVTPDQMHEYQNLLKEYPISQYK